MNNKKLVSVVVLKEGFVDQQLPQEQPLFEESIYLFELDPTAYPKAELASRIREAVAAVEVPYKNQAGELIEWRVFKIIDIFENIYNLQVTESPTEVYSRNFNPEKGLNRKNILATFYSDYVWEESC